MNFRHFGKSPRDAFTDEVSNRTNISKADADRVIRIGKLTFRFMILIRMLIMIMFAGVFCIFSYLTGLYEAMIVAGILLILVIGDIVKRITTAIYEAKDIIDESTTSKGRPCYYRDERKDE